MIQSVGIVGLGYVGLPLCLSYALNGIKVIGFDIDSFKIQSIKNKNSYINYISNEELDIENFTATSDFSQISNVNAIILCVPTPLNNHNEPNMEYVISSFNSICPHLKKNQIISLESTTYPGSVEEIFLSKLNNNFNVGEDIFLVYSPEREDPGNEKYSNVNIPKIVAGYTANCLNKGLELYNLIFEELVSASSIKIAETAKLLENIYRAVNIGLVNELKIICDKMEIDVFEVIDMAATKPFGFTPFYPGPGIGGHCIPIDPFYLTWKAKEYGLHTRFIELAGEINNYMKKYVVEKSIFALNKNKKSINGSKILILGLAYKKNVNDMRESPAVDIIQQLQDLGAILDYNDPYIKSFPHIRKGEFNLNYIELNKENLQSYDLVILITDHDCYDYDFIYNNSKLLVDTRSKFKSSNKVIKS